MSSPSFGADGKPRGPSGFNERLSWDEILMQRWAVFMRAIEEQNVDFMRSGGRALDVCIPPAMTDAEFMEAIHELDADWQEQRAIKELKYQRELKAAVDKEMVRKPPNKPTEEYWIQYGHIVASAFERHGLGLKPKRADDL